MNIIRKKEKEKCMFSRLIIDGNSVYEIDEECLKRRNVPPECNVREAIERQKKKEQEDKQT